MMKQTLMVLCMMFFSTVDLPAESRVDYQTEVKPLLKAKCFACHSALKQKLELRLDAASLILKGSRRGPVLVAGNASESLLIQKITATDLSQRMPPEGEGEPLTADQITLLKRWIDQGARMLDEAIPSAPTEHWSFQQPVRTFSASTGNPIDYFLTEQLASLGIQPVEAAGRAVLLRRITFDLTGLPPTRSQLKAFLSDDSPRAYERVVDQLLARPEYGERWGRHWMDVWRYSDWAGFGKEIRYSQKHIWRWRDWIVDSLNADKGYDQMIVEMLAADERYPGDGDKLRATGFLARNWYKFDRNVWLDDVIEHTGKAFLGMTFKCARCHDHKYDPISQSEYYQLRTIFEPYDVRTDRVPGQVNVDKDGLARIFDARPDALTYLFQRGDPKLFDKQQPQNPDVPDVLGGTFQIEPVVLQLEDYYPAIRDFVTRDLLRKAEDSLAAAEEALLKVRTTSDTENPDHVIILTEKKRDLAQARREEVKARIEAEQAKYRRSDVSDLPDDEQLASQASRLEKQATVAEADVALASAISELHQALVAAQETPGDKTSKAVDAAKAKVKTAEEGLVKATESAAQESTSYQTLGPLYPPSSTGRRLALAKWIIDPGNSLTARVAVNHIWLRHFGRALVEQVDDFGLRTTQPVLIKLLDYLAIELMEKNWSMKHLHRLIVTSRAYRMSSSVPLGNTLAREKDRDNTLFWRQNPRRMEAEAVRDSILYVSASLERRMGGPEVDHMQGMTVPRRSLYFRHARERQMEFLRLFDAANPRECYDRDESIRPQQVFALINSPLTLAQSRKLAGRLTEQLKSIKQPLDNFGDEGFVRAAFETVLSRSPVTSELDECRRFLTLQARQLSDTEKLDLLGETANSVAADSDPHQRARENLILVLFNHNDFVTLR